MQEEERFLVKHVRYLLLVILLKDVALTCNIRKEFSQELTHCVLVGSDFFAELLDVLVDDLSHTVKHNRHRNVLLIFIVRRMDALNQRHEDLTQRDNRKDFENGTLAFITKRFRVIVKVVV